MSNYGMKALVAGGLVGVAALGLAPVEAATKVDLDLGGFFSGGLAVTTLDEDERNHKLGSDSEIYFKGKAKLDNGLTIGFKAEMELEDDGSGDKTDSIDEVFVYFQGGFGKVIFGQEDGIGDLFNVQSPRSLQEHTVNDHDMDPLKVTDIQTVNETSGDSLKIIYMTPSFSGLKFGISYAPDAEKNSAGYTPADEDAGDEIWEMGVLYKGKVEEIGIEFAATYVTADDGDVLESKEWNAGLSLTCGAFEVAGSYRDSEGNALKLFGNKHDAYQAWDAGVGYSTGPWVYTLQYGEESGETELGVETRDGRAVMVSGRYEFVQGFRLGAGVLFEEDDVSGTDGTAFLIETALKF